ncbi:LIM domain-binding protein 1b isoform X7 [Lates japonicus]|uniref:LIM domain-binding protein 1b isoform X7 n=1 Tax=Lates japonicus TaxID=270547 RepID=A0AAD3MT39_LATJO|nr:LIM domain-binding protein 1b isoform X7 [Lates japonicus]
MVTGASEFHNVSPTYLEPGIGRHTPYGNQTDYRIFELNKRLQNWTEVCVGHTVPGFMFDDMMRIKRGTSASNQHGRLIPAVYWPCICVAMILEPIRGSVRHKTCSSAPETASGTPLPEMAGG